MQYALSKFYFDKVYIIFKNLQITSNCGKCLQSILKSVLNYLKNLLLKLYDNH